jgi:hypothetical protein
MKKKLYKSWMFIPITGIALFIVFFVVAANFYPGGSTISRTKEGFDWINNYWCDLFSKTAKNGESNPGRIYGLTGIILLFSSLIVFWYYLPQFFHERKRNTFIIRYTGSISMFILIFVFTRFHDSVIGIGSTISAIPMIATLNELKKNHLKILYFYGWLCVFLLLLNFFIYITNWSVAILPLLQKITLLLFLIWKSIIALKCFAISRDRYRMEHSEKHSKLKRGLSPPLP